ncbi:SMC-Scp complex subunit ScpB [Candidatus Methanomassiliicoccus intestinalis]|uniref:SMC-Scp complex subunit ScpB n=1 Tax=Candidatus Methanomassiliicoccus intestinalis TaxID=1406512 RepID=UPI0037DCEDBC
MDLQPVRIIEAVLFSSPQPVRISDMETQTQLSAATIRKALKDLTAEYESRETSLRVAKVGSGYALLLKDEYAPFGHAFAPKEIPDNILRTASWIAYHQPVLQSDLAHALGSKTYADVKELHSLGLIAMKKKGHSYVLSTTKRFPEYFGINGSSPAAIKKYLKERAKGN